MNAILEYARIQSAGVQGCYIDRCSNMIPRTFTTCLFPNFTMKLMQVLEMANHK